jgi:hypothetical protein
VTINLKDFPAEALTPYNLEAQHPDEFIMALAESDPVGVLETIAEMRLSLKKPPLTLPTPEGGGFSVQRSLPSL